MQEFPPELLNFGRRRRDPEPEPEIWSAQTIQNSRSINWAGLEMEHYLETWRGLPANVLTHVSRIGRDHAGFSEHRLGIGEIKGEFKGLLEAGRLQSVVGRVLIGETIDEVTSRRMLNQFAGDDLTNPDLPAFMINLRSHGNPRSFSDYTSVHFAESVVLDSFYGGEKGNEVFFVLPKIAAAQHAYRGRYLKGSAAQNLHNDTWVWTPGHTGIDINAGIVFLPESARVDPETGSRYRLGPDGKMITREEAVKALVGVVGEAKALLSEKGYYADMDDIINMLKNVPASSLPDMRDPRLWNAFPGNRSLLQFVQYESTNDKEEYEERKLRVAKGLLSDVGILYEEVSAGRSVSSKDYWTEYFLAKPTSRPSRIVYYSDADPTTALTKWLKTNGISEEADFEKIGLSEVDLKDPMTHEGMDEFIKHAKKFIAEANS